MLRHDMRISKLASSVLVVVKGVFEASVVDVASVIFTFVADIISVVFTYVVDIAPVINGVGVFVDVGVFMVASTCVFVVLPP